MTEPVNEPTPSDRMHSEPTHSEPMHPDPTPTPPRDDRADRRRSRTWPRTAAIAAGIALAFGLGVCVSGDSHPVASESTAQEVWTCPMHPQIRMNEPGTCPICGMSLVRVEDAADAPDESTRPGRITLSDRAVTLAQLRTSKIKPMTTQSHGTRLLGRVDYDETRIKTVTAWIAGRIDDLLVASTGTRIRRGQAIARLYSPELYTAASDLLEARQQVQRLASASQTTRDAARATVESARQRLRLLGVPGSEIAALEKRQTPPRQVAIRSPFAGTVIERLVAEGNYVDAGTALYRLVDLSRVWVQLDAYDSDIALLAVGNRVTLEVTGVPGKTFTGTVAFIDPVVDPRTRIIRVRVEVDNRTGELRPGMFAEAVLYSGDAPGEARAPDAPDARRAPPLALPATAPLFTGRRSIVYVEVPDQDRPTYEAREVVLGRRVGDVYPVLSGLTLGEYVVTRGAFVLDADLQIKGGVSMMTKSDDTTGAPRIDGLPARLEHLIDDIVTAYLGVQESLLAEDLAAVHTGNRAIERAIIAAASEVPQRLRSEWDPLSVELLAYSRHLATAQDVAAARRAFEGVSEGVIALLSHYRNATPDSLALVFCPDALDGRGARWVQRSGAIGNPYAGAGMRDCGQIRGEVAPGQTLRAPAIHDSGHDRDRSSTTTGHQH